MEVLRGIFLSRLAVITTVNFFCGVYILPIQHAEPTDSVDFQHVRIKLTKTEEKKSLRILHILKIFWQSHGRLLF
jgi:hypothetical protein